MNYCLIACEYSGAVRDSFKSKGWDAWSCDLLPTDVEGKHIQGDVIEVINEPWDFVGAHPPCTYLTNSGVRWLYNKDGSKNIERWIQLEEGVKFFNLLKSNILVGYIENPIPHKYARDGFYSVVTGEWVDGIGHYSQVIQPWQFGHGETKATCLWLKGLPPLRPTNIVEGREARIHRLPPSKDRWKERSKTFAGIAKAMAEQWSEYYTQRQLSLFNQ